MKNKEKTYEFSKKGLMKAKADCKQDKIDSVVNIGFWVIVIGLGMFGVIEDNKIISLAACTSTSKLVKYVI